MDRYRHPAMRQLKDQQVRFAPADKRIEQVDHAEQLLAEILAERNYPYQFVFFRLTGYRPDSFPDLLLDGDELAHDLRLFIEDVSASTRLDATAAGEPVLTVDELSRNLNVSSKTIGRWRDRGLVSRCYVFGGRRRLGFRKSSVERFLAAHTERVDRGSRFSRISDTERDAIIRRARRMARMSERRPSEIMRRIASKLRRSLEAVRYTILAYDRDHPTRAVFPRRNASLNRSQKSAVYRAYGRGESVGELARKYGRTRSRIYGVINEMRARELLAQKIEFMSNPAFDEPDADATILELNISDFVHDESPETDATPSQATRDMDSPLDATSFSDTPLLTREAEGELFRRMNYLKFKACRLRDSINPQFARSSTLDEIDRLLGQANAVKNHIISANMRLVASIAKRHLGAAERFDELLSDGSLALMRAVEKFDFARGTKFSTYATWAIMKNFARSIPTGQHRRDRFRTGLEELFDSAADSRRSEHWFETQIRQMRSSIAKILDQLDDRERTIIVARFGLGDGNEPQTLEQVGQTLGVTKERIRQIEFGAMKKLRRLANEERLEPPED